jgi:uncharacterized membrane protein YgcG
MGNVHIAHDVRFMPCRAISLYRESDSAFMARILQGGSSVRILKRITLAISGLLFAAVAALVVGASSASAAAVPATGVQSLVAHGHHGCGGGGGWGGGGWGGGGWGGGGGGGCCDCWDDCCDDW